MVYTRRSNRTKGTRKQSRQSYTLPSIAWMYWDTPTRPDLIQKIHDYNLKHVGSWTVHFLDKTSVYKYIPKSEFPRKYNGLKPAHKADWIRLTLLSKYGGVWIDASILLNDSSALDRLRKQSIEKQSAFTGFSYRNKEPGKKSIRGISLYIENWFIMAPKESIIIKLWLEEYEKAIELGFMSYRHSLDEIGVDTSRIFEKPTSTYLTQHACLQKVLQTGLAKIPPMIILPAEESMFKLRYKCKSDSSCIMNSLQDAPEASKSIPYIKLISADRDEDVDLSEYFDE